MGDTGAMAGGSHKPIPSERGLQVTERLTIPEGELSWQFTRSGGPGGQHANTSDTRVDVRFDIANSAVLDDRQRSRLTQQFGDEARVIVDRHRSQWKNRVEARSQLAGRIRAALAPPKAPPGHPPHPRLPAATPGGQTPTEREEGQPSPPGRRLTPRRRLPPCYNTNSSSHSV